MDSPATNKVTTRPVPISTTTEDPIELSQCGNRNIHGVGTKVDGLSESQFGEWPHMCSVMGSLLGKPTHFCGASLISPGVVLTAAHCVRRYVGSPDRLRIWCGEWDLRQDIEPRPVQGRDIQSIVMHPEYNYDLKNISNYKYDIAVLFTTKDFFLNRHINTICLPSVDDMFDGRKCIATGWERGNGILKKKTMPIVDNTFCQVKASLNK